MTTPGDDIDHIGLSAYVGRRLRCVKQGDDFGHTGVLIQTGACEFGIKWDTTGTVTRFTPAMLFNGYYELLP